MEKEDKCATSLLVVFDVESSLVQEQIVNRFGPNVPQIAIRLPPWKKTK